LTQRKTLFWNFFEKSDFYGCGNVFHFARAYQLWEFPGNSLNKKMFTFMIETPWKCPEEPPKKIWITKLLILFSQFQSEKPA
jgi:hypothetical protein